MIIKNCRIIFEDKISEGSVKVNNGLIEKINPESQEDALVIDAEGAYLSPGFIDVHIHGAGGRDTMEGSYEALNVIAKAIAKHGTTSFLPTTMTVDKDEVKTAVKAIYEAKKTGTEGANVLGVHLEGPFINSAMIGAQNPNYVLSPSIEAFKYMTGEFEDAVVCVTLAPEVEGAKELIAYLKEKGIRASMGHTKATYDQAIEGIKCGVCHSTHLFNAMTPLHHRDPGAVGAIFDTDITTETISDGIHVSYPSLRIAYKQKGLDKVLLVSDAMMACSMPDGKYSLGGQEVIVSKGAARIANGALAGSVLTLDRAVKNVYANTSYPLHEIVKMASYNAAKHCGVEDHKGKIQEGYDADLILFDEDINIKKVIIGGKVID
ncbi:N-acetylglucosamine-6-phosphate deacetylase [Clostridium polynesiense]|uniref:N-acetylglucosamine-6-phosphate deacetylase n=1 Tax=Clostridium polynesiense TaxID=1325933 RepID=UPI00058DF623|nr:N-acetylglucosamine-6-phosphate deacetylase [Clostridium polynesiense]